MSNKKTCLGVAMVLVIVCVSYLCVAGNRSVSEDYLARQNSALKGAIQQLETTEEDVRVLEDWQFTIGFGSRFFC